MRIRDRQHAIIVFCFIVESWVHIGTPSQSGSQNGGTPGSVTPQLLPEDYLRLLREAQRESSDSSTRVSPRSSPKSPPNSPIQGNSLIEWQSYYVNSSDSRNVSFFSIQIITVNLNELIIRFYFQFFLDFIKDEVAFLCMSFQLYSLL